MIVVSAAAGQFGRLVVERLLERCPAQELAVAVRNPASAQAFAERGIEVRHADYDEKASLVSAFRGADRLLFISSPLLDQERSRLGQHRNVVSAAQEAGVGLIAYTSGLSADQVDADAPVIGDHHVTEEAIKDSGIPNVLLRHPLYTDLFINESLEAAIDTGELASSSGGRGMNTASRADLAEASAAILTCPDPEPAYDFTGRAWTFPQLADALSDVSGRPVAYREGDQDDGAIGFMGLGPFVRSGGFELQTPTLEAVLGRPAASLRDAVAVALA